MARTRAALRLLACLALTPAIGCEDLLEANDDGLSDDEPEDRTDRDGDGVPASVDCDDRDPSRLGPTAWYGDGDGDGYGAGAAIEACSQPTGSSSNAQDCDDSNAGVNPEATERCNGFDDDCDGDVDDEDSAVEGLVEAWTDADNDGWGNPEAPVMVCGLGTGVADQPDDCDDSEAGVNPGAEEICRNGIDDDCSPSACEWDVTVSLTHEAGLWVGEEGDFAGAAVGAAGDVDGDGRPDLLVGLPYADNPTYNGGAVALVSGPTAEAGGDLRSGLAFIQGTDEDGFAGQALAGADIDGDGYSDVVLGAPDAWAGVGAGGRVSLFFGPVEGTVRAGTADVRWDGPRTGDRAGRDLAFSSSLSGDGTVDLIIASSATDASVAPVAAWIVEDPTQESLLDDAVRLTASDLDRAARHVLAVVPDLNGDGIDELAVGRPRQGTVWLHLGPLDEDRAVLDADRTWSAPETSSAGTSLAGVADVRGSGSGGLLVGAPDSGASSGRVYLLTGADGSGELAGSASTEWRGAPASAAGASLATMDGPRGPRVLVGGPSADDAELSAGTVWVVDDWAEGSHDLDGWAASRLVGGADFAGAGAGAAVTSPGDLDGDGYSDVAVGAPNEASGGVAAGAVYVLPGLGE